MINFRAARWLPLVLATSLLIGDVRANQLMELIGAAPFDPFCATW